FPAELGIRLRRAYSASSRFPKALLRTPPQCARSDVIGRAEPQESALLRPPCGDWLEPLHISRRQRNRLTAFKNRFDNVRREERQRENPAHFAIVYPRTSRDLGGRFCRASRKLLVPYAGLRDRVDKILVDGCWTSL